MYRLVCRLWQCLTSYDVVLYFIASSKLLISLLRAVEIDLSFDHFYV